MMKEDAIPLIAEARATAAEKDQAWSFLND